MLRGHPWLFSGSISLAPHGAQPGDVIDLVDKDGRFVARGYFNPACDIAVRILTLSDQEQIDKAFLRNRVQAAIALRNNFINREETNVYRLINAEGDFLPGLIADVFDRTIVVQSHTAGADRLVSDLISVLKEEVKPEAIVLRNDASVRKREGLKLEPPQVVLGSELLNEQSPFVTVRENGLQFKVDPICGQKTGFFADQRDKRVLVKTVCGNLAPDAVLANCFCYSAAFSIYAVSANSKLRTINIDESTRALDLARESFTLNKLTTDNHEFIASDCFDWLEEQVKEKKQFQFIILDPPPFAKSHKDVKNALKAYTRLNRLALKCVAPGGYLLTCSCSGAIGLDDLEACLRTAAGEVERPVQMLEIFKHGADHPTNVAAPETQYLKALMCRVL